MLKNYHTHTFRCRHAEPDERQYIESAIAAGIKTLGFADHVPVAGFPADYYSTFRMTPEQLPEYIAVLQAFKKECARDIDILIGFEMEYYPACFEATLSLLAPYDYDYLLLGQHCLSNEFDDPAAVAAMQPDRLRQYVEQVTAGMRTGAFAYLAHPDLLCFAPEDREGERLMAQICETALEMDMPLECNLLGISNRRRYPTERFFRMAAAYDCTVILGCDAHSAVQLNDPETERAARDMLARCGVRRITEEIRLHKPLPDL